MIKFRKHRGSLVESMKTVKEYETIKDLIEDVKKDWQEWGDFEVVYEKYSHFDKRINWKEVYIVMIKNYNYNFPVGFISGFNGKRIDEKNVVTVIDDKYSNLNGKEFLNFNGKKVKIMCDENKIYILVKESVEFVVKEKFVVGYFSFEEYCKYFERVGLYLELKYTPVQIFEQEKFLKFMFKNMLIYNFVTKQFGETCKGKVCWKSKEKIEKEYNVCIFDSVFLNIYN